MGDSGAYFLGYVIAAASILGHLKIHAVFALGPTALFVLFPTLRMARVMVRRLLRRRNPLVIGGLTQRDHRILTRLSPVRTCLVLWGFSLVLNVAGMVREHMSLSVILTTVVGVLVLLAAILLVPRPLGTGHRLRSKPESERSG